MAWEFDEDACRLDLDLEGADVDGNVAVLIIIHESNKIIIKDVVDCTESSGKPAKQGHKNS